MTFFLRVFQHLLPRSPTWSLTQNKDIRKFFEGLAAALEDPDPEIGPRAAADAVLLDAFPAYARPDALAEWEHQFGLAPSPNDAAKRIALADEWRATGGQSPGYIQGVLQAAGFDLYVYEWWSSGPPTYVARDPRTYTQHPRVGTYRCTALADNGPRCARQNLNQPRCNAFLSGEPGYLVNKDLTQRPPPPVPDDPATWPYFLYIGAATFPDRAVILSSRRAALERLVLKLCPAHLWIVMLVDYDTRVFDLMFDNSFA